MATGRKYIVRYTHRNRVNRFSPSAYNSAASAITGARFRKVVSALTLYPIPDRKVVIVTHSKLDSGVSSYIKDVLKQNGVNTKKVNQGNRKTEFTFDNADTGQKALSIINKMRGDELLLSKIDYSGSIPVGTSENGLKVPLEGYTQEQQANNDAGHDPFKKQSESAEQAETEAADYAKWFLIGGAVLVGVIVLLAVLKKNKKI